MPLEGDTKQFTIPAPVVETEAQKTIRRAREILDSPGSWTKGSMGWHRASLAGGDRLCILGALGERYDGDHRAAWMAKPYVEVAIRAYVSGQRPRLFGLIGARYSWARPTAAWTFNDHPHTRHADVLAVLDRAYELAGKK